MSPQILCTRATCSPLPPGMNPRVECPRSSLVLHVPTQRTVGGGGGGMGRGMLEPSHYAQCKEEGLSSLIFGIGVLVYMLPVLHYQTTPWALTAWGSNFPVGACLTFCVSCHFDLANYLVIYAVKASHVQICHQRIVHHCSLTRIIAKPIVTSIKQDQFLSWQCPTCFLQMH